MKKWVFALVVGIVLLSIASTAARDNTIRCGSEIMGPGDVCEETRAGSTVDTKTYEEMKESHDASRRFFESGGRWAMVGVGALLTIGGIIGIMRVRRRRRAQPDVGPVPPGQQPQATPSGYPPQATPPGYPPQQQYAPQQQFPPQGPPPQFPPQQQYPPQNWGPPGPQR
ncbi:hypothetical protein [Actinophytocola sp.]|uniref:hypothetical protein n=1 Tax=Actinophytocola sp. TaxID=1872138 RepID=UPI002ED2C461